MIPFQGFMFYDPSLFCALFKRYALYLLQNVQKGEGAQKIKCVFLPYKKPLFYQAYAKNLRVPGKPPPPTLNLGKESPPLCCVGKEFLAF